MERHPNRYDKTREPQSLFLTLVVASAVCFTTACADAPTVPVGSEESETQAFSSQDWFRGIVFADGPVAKNLPEIRDNYLLEERAESPAMLAKAREAIDLIIADIERTHPGSLDEVKQLLTSEDRIEIVAGMRTGMTLARDAAKARYGETGSGAQIVDQGLCLFVVWQAVAVVATAVYEYEALTINAGAAVNLALYLYTIVYEAVAVPTNPEEGLGDFPTDGEGTPAPPDGERPAAIVEPVSAISRQIECLVHGRC